jgi:cytochrome c oxidase subunit 2
MHFKIEDEGEYYGQCYQFCGLRHSDMKFVLDARSEQDYLSWLSSQPKTPAPGASSEQAPSLQPAASTEGQ